MRQWNEHAWHTAGAQEHGYPSLQPPLLPTFERLKKELVLPSGLDRVIEVPFRGHPTVSKPLPFHLLPEALLN